MNDIFNGLFIVLCFLLIYICFYILVNRICQAFERCSFFKAAASCGQPLIDPYKNDGEGQS